MKIVINNCYGGFSISPAAREYISARIGKDVGEYPDIQRNDPILIEAVEKLAKKADGGFSELKIVEIPDDVKWHIAEYDGIEWVAEDHRRWE
jgi:hypothetical protein